MVPLLGPIGGGLGFGASPSAGFVVVVGVAAAVAGAAGVASSSAALTTSLGLLFFEGKNTKLLLLEPELVLAATLGVNKKPEAADAMLQLAMFCLTTHSLSLLSNGK